MGDIFDKQKRSEIMSAVKSDKNKSTELRLIGIFKQIGIKGWRRNYKINGKPDFVFLKEKVAVFTDGCFWHGHGCRNIVPKNNKEYWEKKMLTNQIRDKAVTEYLQSKKWKVVRVWECELIKKNQHVAIAKIQACIMSVKEDK